MFGSGYASALAAAFTFRMSTAIRYLLPAFSTMTAGLVHEFDDGSITPAASISRTYRCVSSPNFLEIGYCFCEVGHVFPTSISCSAHVVRPSKAYAGASTLFKRACKRWRFFNVISTRFAEEASIVSMDAIQLCVGSFGSNVETQSSSSPTLFPNLPTINLFSTGSCIVSKQEVYMSRYAEKIVTSTTPAPKAGRNVRPHSVANCDHHCSECTSIIQRTNAEPSDSHLYSLTQLVGFYWDLIEAGFELLYGGVSLLDFPFVGALLGLDLACGD